MDRGEEVSTLAMGILEGLVVEEESGARGVSTVSGVREHRRRAMTAPIPAQPSLAAEGEPEGQVQEQRAAQG